MHVKNFLNVHFHVIGGLVVEEVEVLRVMIVFQPVADLHSCKIMFT